MKHISIIGTAGVPACYGGFESLVENLLDYTPENVEYTVFCSAKKYDKKLDTYKGAKLIYLDIDANGKDSILYDYKSMKMSLNADIMLILGVSGCMFLKKIRKHFSGKIITNIDGLEWRREKWNFLAKKVLKYSEQQAVKYSDIIIGDNRGITDYVKYTYDKDAVLIAYGGNHVKKITDYSLYEKYPFCRDNYAVTVCRIEPENNIHLILEAFSLTDYPLVMAGNFDHSEYGKALKQKYSAFKHIHLLNPIYDSHIINWLRGNAGLYIHGHSAGGTNPSLVEAMNLGLPVLAFDCVYNRATTENSCFYWQTADELLSLLKTPSTELSENGKKMSELASRLYTWKHIAGQYNNLY